MLPGAGPFGSASAEDWQVLRDAVGRFEVDWRQGTRPKIDDYLPKVARSACLC
jgi:hypothetical protein